MLENIKQLIRKCPFLVLLVSTGILFSLLGLCGKKNVYAGQEYDPLKEPALVMVFQALKEDVYPWQIFDQESTQVMASGEGDMEDGAAGSGEDGDTEAAGADESAGNAVGTDAGESPENAGDEDAVGADPDGGVLAAREENGEKSEENAGDTEVGSGEEIPAEAEDDGQEADGENTGEGSKSQPIERIEPLRESTREEYLNHISADIYGDAGVKRAAEYEFAQVDESYFDDALFIGDSRTVGLRDYTDLSEHADFYCETSLTIQKMLEEDFPGLGTIEEALAGKEYGKIYIMLGINELGVGTTEDFIGQYAEAVAFLREKEPEAKIFIQGIMRVTGKKNSSDAIFNNSNINARNNAIATLADNEQIFYIDVNEVVCDEEGNLNSEYTFDQLHLLGKYDDLWKQFLLSHGVVEEGGQ